MQSRLPDINTAFIKYRNEVIGAIKRLDFNQMHGSLNAINGMLPDQYQVTISTAKYEDLTRTDIQYLCKTCTANSKEPVEIPKESIRVFELYPNAMQGLLYGGIKDQVWVCPKCLTTHRLKETDISVTKLQDPYFIGVVPNPPNRKQGLMDKLTFNDKTVAWGWQMLNELEHKMALFRDDNWSRGDELEGFDDIDTSSEESE